MKAAPQGPPDASWVDVTAFGAVGDGRTLNTAALQKAVDACQAGGRVFVPAGVFVSGTLRLRSSTKPGQSGTCFSIILPCESAAKAVGGLD